MSFVVTVIANTYYAHCPEQFPRSDALAPHSSSMKQVLLPLLVLVRVLREAEAKVGLDVAEIYRAECLPRVKVGQTAVERSEGRTEWVGRASDSSAVPRTRRPGYGESLWKDQVSCRHELEPIPAPHLVTGWAQPGGVSDPGQAAPTLRFTHMGTGGSRSVKPPRRASTSRCSWSQVSHLLLYEIPGNNPESQIVTALTPRHGERNLG